MISLFDLGNRDGQEEPDQILQGETGGSAEAVERSACSRAGFRGPVLPAPHNRRNWGETGNTVQSPN